MTTSPNNVLPETSQPQSSGAGPYTPGLSDGLGDRLMMFDNASQSSVEFLRFKREFSDAPGFEDMLRKRVDDLTRFKHQAVAVVRGVQTLDNGEGLALVSNNTPGRRLSEMVHVAKGAPFAMDLIQQLAPALSALHQLGPAFAHGTLTAERIVITREGKLVVVEHVLASAFETLRLPAARLRTDLGIAVPAGPGPFGLNQRSDVVQLGFIALSLLLGRRLDPAHYPANIPTLLDEFAALDAAASARMRGWLERSLQISDKPFATAQDAEAGVVERPASAVARPATPAPPPAPEAPAVSEPEKAPVLAFRSPEAPAPVVAHKPKDDIAITSRATTDIGVYAPEEESKPIRLQEPGRSSGPLSPAAIQHANAMAHSHAPSVTAVASPRARGGSSALKWIVIAIVALGTIIAGLYASGMFGARDAAAPPPSTPKYTQTSPVPADPITPEKPGKSEPPTIAPEPQPAATTTPAPPTVAPASTPAASPSGSTSSGSTSGSTTPPSSTTTGSTPASTSTPASGSSSTPVSTPAGAASAAGIAAVPPKPSTGAFGAVKVAAAIDLQVFENGNLIGTSAANVALVDGTHTLELVNESLGFRVRSTVNVKPGGLTPIAIALPNGRVSINAVPWADVFIDGRPAGQTPLANVVVTIGPHDFVFRHPQFGEQKQTVLVRADGLTRVTATFQQ